MIDLIKEIWQTMNTNRLRTFLTGLSVAWGIFMLILLLAVSNGVISSFEQRATQNDPYGIDIYGGTTTMAYHGLKEGREITLRERDFDDVRRSASSSITDVSGSINFSTTLSTTRDYVAASCQGVYPTDRRANDIGHIDGRWINDADIQQQRKVLVIPKKNAETLFGSADNAVGKIVNASSLAFTIVGTYEHQWRDDIFMPYTTARSLKGFDDKVDAINVNISHSIATTDQANAVEADIRQGLARSKQFDADDPNALWIRNRFADFMQALTGLNILNIAMWVIGLLTLITGIVGVSNIMFVSVRERTHEIGIRRAIGAKPRSILRQIVCESIAMTTVFGYIGIVMGTIATEIVKKIFAGSDFMIEPNVDLNIALEVTIALIIAGALAGIFPARRATRVRPVEALRDE